MKFSTWLAGTALALLGGCFQDSTPQHSGFLPLDYQSTFHLVRDCRLVTDHQNTFERVLANPLASDFYSTANYPIPAGGVVVAEEHTEASCNSLNGYYLMAKEKPGYDRAAADWHWQRLDINQRMVQDGKLKDCSSCHAKCAASDHLCSPL